MEKDSSKCPDPYPMQYFDEFIGHELEIECVSWKYEFAAKIWGPNMGGKTTKQLLQQPPLMLSSQQKISR